MPPRPDRCGRLRARSGFSLGYAPTIVAAALSDLPGIVVPDTGLIPD